MVAHDPLGSVLIGLCDGLEDRGVLGERPVALVGILQQQDPRCVGVHLLIVLQPAEVIAAGCVVNLRVEQLVELDQASPERVAISMSATCA